MDQFQYLFQISRGFWQSSLLHTAVRLNIFTELSAKPLTAIELASRINADKRATELLLNALVGMDLLKKEGNMYFNTSLSKKFLVEDSPLYLGFIIRHIANMYSYWGRLEEAIKNDRPLRSPIRNPEEMENFILGMHNLAQNIAPILIKNINLEGIKNLLDLGGGSGTYSIHFCKAYPNLKVTLCDLPNVLPITERVIKSFGMSDCIRLVARDFHKDPLPSPFDVAWLSNILHGSSPGLCESLIKKVYNILNPKGKIIIQDFILDETKTKPPFASLFALNMLIHTSGGRTYSLSEIKNWLIGAGFTHIKRLKIRLPNDASIIMATRV